MENSELIVLIKDILLLIIALVGVLLGPIITMKIHKKNLSYNFKTQNNQKRLDTIIDAVISFSQKTIEWHIDFETITNFIGKDNLVNARGENFKEVNENLKKMKGEISRSYICCEVLLDVEIGIEKSILTILNQHLLEIKGDELFNKETFEKLHGDLIKEVKILIKKHNNEIEQHFT